MTILRKSMTFPQQTPQEYIMLQNEPAFDASKHLQLEKPQTITTLQDLHYPADICSKMPSQLGITSAFRIFSDEGLAVVYDLAKRMESNKNQSDGTGKKPTRFVY